MTAGDEVKNTDRYCFRVPYVAHLLRNGLQLLDSQVFTSGGKQFSWTLGAAVLEGGLVITTPLPSGAWDTPHMYIHMKHQTGQHAGESVIC